MTQSQEFGSEHVIYYASAYVFGRELVGKRHEISEKCANAILHVYSSSPNNAAAGAVLADMCSTLKLEFIEYAYLPAVEGRETLFKPPEHRKAYELAASKGISCIISSIVNDAGEEISWGEI
jgi:hypothetical protein